MKKIRIQSRPFHTAACFRSLRIELYACTTVRVQIPGTKYLYKVYNGYRVQYSLPFVYIRTIDDG